MAERDGGQPNDPTTRNATQMTSSPAFAPRMNSPLCLLLVASLVLVLSGAVSVILFVASLFSHQALLFTVALIALITSMLAQALIIVWRAWFLWHSGAWMGLDGKPRSRAERPGWFKTWLAMHVLYAGVTGGVAAYLTWTLFASSR
ncbi:MAG: hypothetical protein Q8L23_09195 [Caulobacter sp.]|nr:hypothetical protein [Caulobacter sp.]